MKDAKAQKVLDSGSNLKLFFVGFSGGRLDDEQNYK